MQEEAATNRVKGEDELETPFTSAFAKQMLQHAHGDKSMRQAYNESVALGNELKEVVVDSAKVMMITLPRMAILAGAVITTVVGRMLMLTKKRKAVTLLAAKALRYRISLETENTMRKGTMRYMENAKNCLIWTS